MLDVQCPESEPEWSDPPSGQSDKKRCGRENLPIDEPLKDIGKNLGIDFSGQHPAAGEVRSLLAYVKQSS